VYNWRFHHRSQKQIIARTRTSHMIISVANSAAGVC
jgi:hypothetical protein